MSFQPTKPTCRPDATFYLSCRPFSVNFRCSIPGSISCRLCLPRPLVIPSHLSAPWNDLPTLKPSPTSHPDYPLHPTSTGPLPPSPFASRTRLGKPNIPDPGPSADPRGMTVRECNHLDIVVHPTPSIPVRTGAQFLEYLRMLLPRLLGRNLLPLWKNFVTEHSSALTFVQTPEPAPTSYGK
ncbi:hypothetical protein D9613_012761 [Agrocybe pediades]|uniref:Uncharacterized protein n=1 Tax=Agrocybe pediades TaxID=84607 RepID=A0A8H4QKB7_9AGAR|nr:hypothetical protein D9613_012761 [Agrocybe pediades]